MVFEINSRNRSVDGTLSLTAISLTTQASIKTIEQLIFAEILASTQQFSYTHSHVPRRLHKKPMRLTIDRNGREDMQRTYRGAGNEDSGIRTLGVDEDDAKSRTDDDNDIRLVDGRGSQIYAARATVTTTSTNSPGNVRDRVAANSADDAPAFWPRAGQRGVDDK